MINDKTETILKEIEERMSIIRSRVVRQYDMENEEISNIDIAIQILLRKIDDNLEDLYTLLIGRKYLEIDDEENYKMNMLEIAAIIDDTIG